MTKWQNHVMDRHYFNHVSWYNLGLESSQHKQCMAPQESANTDAVCSAKPVHVHVGQRNFCQGRADMIMFHTHNCTSAIKYQLFIGNFTKLKLILHVRDYKNSPKKTPEFCLTLTKCSLASGAKSLSTNKSQNFFSVVNFYNSKFPYLGLLHCLSR